MVCVKEIKTGKVERVDDAIAHNRVVGGQWSYCPKSEWKAQRKAGE